jgi:hypothetical protein
MQPTWQQAGTDLLIPQVIIDLVKDYLGCGIEVTTDITLYRNVFESAHEWFIPFLHMFEQLVLITRTRGIHYAHDCTEITLVPLFKGDFPNWVMSEEVLHIDPTWRWATTGTPRVTSESVCRYWDSLHYPVVGVDMTICWTKGQEYVHFIHKIHGGIVHPFGSWCSRENSCYFSIIKQGYRHLPVDTFRRMEDLSIPRLTRSNAMHV